ncbi:MAG: hypothetical protein P8X74_12980 [Reinekea sp.]
MKHLLLLPLLLLSACANLSLTDVYRQPQFEYEKTKVTGVSLSALSGTSEVRITNTNPYSLPVSSLNAKLMLEGQEWMSLDNDAISGLSANDSTSVTFQWEMVYDQLLRRMSDVYQQGQANFTLVMEPTLNVPVLGPQTAVWQADFTVPIPKLPTLSVNDWKVSSLSFSKVELTFDLSIHNPNVFTVNTEGWKAGLKQDNRSLAALNLNDATLAAKSTSQQSLKVALSLADVGVTLANTLTKGEWPNQIALDWQGHWNTPDLGFKLPSLSGSLLSNIE